MRRLPDVDPDVTLRRHYGLTEREITQGTLARSRAELLLRDKSITVIGLHEGDFTLGSFLFLGLKHARAAHGLGLWGLGLRRSGHLETARWHWFRLTESGYHVDKAGVRRALSRRLLAFPGELDGLHVDDPRDVAKLKAAEVLYG